MGKQATDHRRILAELEVTFDVYFDKYVKPHVESARKAYEGYKRQDAIANRHTTHAEDFWKALDVRLDKDQKFCHDISQISQIWRDTVIDKIGKDEYMRLSHQCPSKDLATQYVMERMHDRTCDYVGKLYADSANPVLYVTKGVFDSIGGDLLHELEGKGKNASDEELEKHINLNTSLGLRATKDTTAFVADLALTRSAVFSLMFADADDTLAKKSGVLPVDAIVGKALFGSGKQMEILRQEAKSYNYPGNTHLEGINECLTRSVYGFYNNDVVKQDAELLKKQANGDLEATAAISFRIQKNIEQTNKIQGSMNDVFRKDITSIPKWVSEKSDKELMTYAGKFASVAADMKKKGQKEVLVGNRKMSYGDIVNRCKLYDLALFERGLVITDKSYRGRMNTVGLLAYSGTAPDWIRKMTDAELMKRTAFYTALYSEMDKKGLKKALLGGKEQSIQEIRQRTYDMSNECLSRGIAKRKQEERRAAEQAAKMQTASTSQEDYSADQTLAAANEQRFHEQDTKVAMMDAASQGWNGYMKQLGLDGLTGLGDDLGYTLSMLPDMLFGMLTGKNTSMSIDKAAFPLLMLFGGLFVKNPLLKYMMMAMGGLNILSQGHKEAVARDGQARKAVTAYKRYPEEPQDPRIVFSGMRDGSMICNIDGNPYVVNLDAATIDSFNHGAISQSALCNAVLRSYDETAHISSNERYEQAVSEQQEKERVVQDVVLK